MSLVSTLAKVAIGMAVAKGVSHIAKSGLPGGAASGGGATRWSGTASNRQQTGAAPGGLADMMGDLLGGGAAGAGGLGGLLGQLTRGQPPSRPRSQPTRQNAPGGLDDLLGSLTGATGAARGASGGSGGLGDLLGGLLGGAATGGGIGGLGSLLGDAMSGKPPTQAPSAQQEVAAALMLQAMVQAAKSDGKLDADEKQKLMQEMGDATPAELKFVNDLLAQPVDTDGLVATVPRGMEEQIYVISLMAIDLDSKAEAQYLHDLATALGMPQDMVNDLHDQAGAQRLYS